MSDPHTDPRTADVLDHDTYQPFARRSVHSIFALAFALLLIGIGVGWYFFGFDQDWGWGGPDDQVVLRESSQLADGDIETVENDEVIAQTPSGDVVVAEKIRDPQLPGNEYEEGSGRSGIYDFFYLMFGGIEDGLDDNVHNLENVDNLDQFNIDGSGLENNTDVAYYIDRYAESQAARQAQARQKQRNVARDQAGESPQNVNVRHDVNAVIGGDIYGRQGDKAGKIFDIMVHRETGKARMIVLRDNESQTQRDLDTVRFKKVQARQDDGDVMLSVAEESVEGVDEPYEKADDENYLSLRLLQNGRVIDHRGDIAGSIDTAIYDDREAQNIIFSLKPVMARYGPEVFKISFEEANFIERPGGYDIQLTRQQTARLARTLFSGMLNVEDPASGPQ